MAMRTVTALFVDDEETLRLQYMENLTIALRDSCGFEVVWEWTDRIEEAKSRLPKAQTRYQLVVVDLLWSAIAPGKGGRDSRGLEVIRAAAKTDGVVIVALSVGDTTNFPDLEDDAITAGAHIFLFRGSLQAASRTGGWEGLAGRIGKAFETAKAGKRPSATGRDDHGRDEANERADQAPSRKSLFVVCGRNRAANDSLFALLRAIGLAPYEWEQLVAMVVESRGGGGNPHVLDVIGHGFAAAHGAVVLFTPDDEAQLASAHRLPSDPPYESVLTGQPRPNVLLEAGYALGHDRSHTLIVSVGALRPFSDLSGMHFVHLDNTASKRKALAQRLKAMDFEVDDRGDLWLTVGDFAV